MPHLPVLRTPVAIAALAALLVSSVPLPARVEVGDSPKLEFKAVDGRKVDARFLAKKVVLVDFWATWCGPCVAAMPHMLEVNRKYAGKGLQIVGISLDSDIDRLKKFVAEKKLPWPQHYEGKGWQGELPTKWGVTGIPTVFILSPKGKVLWRGHPMEMDLPLEAALKTHLGLKIAHPERTPEAIKAAKDAFAAARGAMEKEDYKAMFAKVSQIDATLLEDRGVLAEGKKFFDTLMAVEEAEKQAKLQAAFRAGGEKTRPFATLMRAIVQALEVKLGDTPEFTLAAVDGTKIDRKYLDGKLIVIDFWATWCGPCIAAVPHMKKLHEEYSSKGVEILGVSLDRNREAMTRFVADKKMKWRQYWDEGGKLASSWGVSGIPTIFILSPKGEVLWKGHPMAMDDALQKALKDHPPKKGARKA